ncbi:hypothetical protein P9112_010012 [Eukaryota sp. TZLM1-RC]
MYEQEILVTRPRSTPSSARGRSEKKSFEFSRFEPKPVPKNLQVCQASKNLNPSPHLHWKEVTNVKLVGLVDFKGKVISGCTHNAPLITSVKSSVDFGDVVVVGCRSQSIVATDSFIDLETVLVLGSIGTDEYFELKLILLSKI